jgi:competence protein ComEC
MRFASILFLAAAVVVVGATVGAQGQRRLQIYAIDVEGGNSVLFVSPSGESLLFDAGNPTQHDADQMAAAAKEAGLKQIDYLVISHFHADHLGGVPGLAAKLPIRHFIDHGPPMIEPTGNSVAAFKAYAELRDMGHYTPVKAGDKIPIKGLDVEVVNSDRTAITKALPGAGAANPLCKDFKPITENPPAAEDERSVGIVVRYGKFRVIELGDITWTREFSLVCPNNMLRTVDLYFTDRHALTAGSPTFVHAIKPRVAIFDNGARKGADREAFETVKSSPGIEGIWFEHYSVPRPARPAFGESEDQGGKDFNPPDDFVANMAEDHTSTPSYNLKISAAENGSFTVTNERNNFSKEYEPRS